MIGRHLDRLYPERIADRDRAHRAEGQRTSPAAAGSRGVDFELREGEVLGVGGLQGHGQRELFQALFGASRASGTHRTLGQAGLDQQSAPGADRHATASRWCRRTGAGRACC